MIAEGDLDHRYYEYPGLFFYVLYPFLRLVMGAEPPTANAYLAARAVVAACGVAAVALQFAFARHLMAAGPALFSAALLAVSLVAVQTAHSVRPDVALQVLLPRGAHRHAAPGRAPPLGPARGRRPRRRRRDQVLRRVPRPRADRAPPARARPPRPPASCSPGPRPPRSFVIASPYSVLHLGEFVEGVETQVSYHYEESPDPELVKSYGDMVVLYLGIWARALGTPATVLSILGLVAVDAGAAALGAAAARAPDRHRRLRDVPGAPRPVPAARPRGGVSPRRGRVGGGAGRSPAAWPCSSRWSRSRCRCSPRSVTCGTCRVRAPGTARSTGRPRRCRRGPACSRGWTSGWTSRGWRSSR